MNKTTRNGKRGSRELFLTGKLIKPKPIIFFHLSGPANTLDVNASINAIFAALYPHYINNTAAYLAFKLAFSPVLYARYYYYHNKNLIYDDTLAKVCPYHFLLKFDDFPQNQLYLYSKADQACPFVYTDQFIELQKSFGKNVEKKLWEDSPHVAHIKFHHDEYVKLCQDFYRKNFELK